MVSNSVPSSRRRMEICQRLVVRQHQQTTEGEKILGAILDDVNTKSYISFMETFLEFEEQVICKYRETPLNAPPLNAHPLYSARAINFQSLLYQSCSVSARHVIKNHVEPIKFDCVITYSITS